MKPPVGGESDTNHGLIRKRTGAALLARVYVMALPCFSFWMPWRHRQRSDDDFDLIELPDGWGHLTQRSTATT